MGLDIVCECGHVSFRAGSYSGFDEFRHWLARGLGFNLEDYWFGKIKVRTPFRPLLMHSDCDGYLTPKQCKKMIEPMREFIKARKKKLKNPWNVILGEVDEDYEAYLLSKCKMWLEAFEHSAEKNCRLIFT